MILSKPAILIAIVVIAGVGGVAFAMSRRKQEEETVATGDSYETVPGSGEQTLTVDPISVAKQGISILSTGAGLAKAGAGLLGGGAGAGGATTAATGTSAAAAPLAPGGLAPGAAGAGEATATTAGGGVTGGSALLGAAAGFAALAIVIGWAIALGVFKTEDWEPPYGQVPLKLNDYGAAVAGLPSGSIVWLQPEFIDRMAALGKVAGEQLLYSFLEANRKATEDKAAAIQQIQKLNEQVVTTPLVASQLTTQEIKQNVAKKATGNAATQFNFQGRAKALLNYDSPILRHYESKVPFYSTDTCRARRDRRRILEEAQA